MWLRSARMSAGLQLEHLELLHKQLVIVRPHRKVLHAAHHRALRGSIRLIGFCHARRLRMRGRRAPGMADRQPQLDAGPEDRPVRVERVDVGRPLPGVVVIAAHDATAVEQRDREVAARRGDLPLAADGATHIGLHTPGVPPHPADPAPPRP